MRENFGSLRGKRARVSTGIEIMVRFRNDQAWSKSFTRITFANMLIDFNNMFG